MTGNTRIIAAAVIGLAAFPAWGQRSGRAAPEIDQPEATTIVGYDLDRDGRTDAWYYVTEEELARLHDDRLRAREHPVDGRVLGRPLDERGYDPGDYRSLRENPRRAVQESYRWPYGVRTYPAQQPLHEQRMLEERGTRYERALEREYEERIQGMGRAPDDLYTRPAPPPPMGTPAPEQEISGELTELTTLRFAPDNEHHLVGKVRTDTGSVFPVHFGPARDLSGRLEAGDHMTVIGHTGRLDGKRIILANHVLTDEAEYFVDRSQYRHLRHASGEVVDWREVSLPEGGESLLASIRSQDGRTHIVALGPRDDLQRSGIDLLEGDEIAVLGLPETVEGRPVLSAVHLHADARSVILQSSPEDLRASADFHQAYDDLQSRREARADTGRE